MSRVPEDVRNDCKTDDTPRSTRIRATRTIRAKKAKNYSSLQRIETNIFAELFGILKFEILRKYLR